MKRVPEEAPLSDSVVTVRSSESPNTSLGVQNGSLDSSFSNTKDIGGASFSSTIDQAEYPFLPMFFPYYFSFFHVKDNYCAFKILLSFLFLKVPSLAEQVSFFVFQRNKIVLEVSTLFSFSQKQHKLTL